MSVSRVVAISALIVVPVIVGGLWFGLTVVSFLSVLFHGGLWITAPILLLVAAMGWWVRSSAKGGSGAGATLLGIAVAVGFAVSIPLMMFATSSAYARAVLMVDEPYSFRDRAPWVVAAAYASRDQGELVGDKGSVHFVPDPAAAGTSRYTALVTGRSIIGNVGYAAVQEMDLPAVGPIPNTASGYCVFDESMGLRLDAAWPWRSLNRAIHNTRPGALWSGDDAYAYCDGEAPVVVVPLFTYRGFWVVTKHADGAMVYRDGQVRHLNAEQLVVDGVEGPTFPRSLAERQRESLVAVGGFGDWISSRGGFDATDKDEEDSNAGNATEFTLLAADGAIRYVTPLTPRGSSESIVAVFDAPAQQGGVAARVNTRTDLPATSTLATAVREASVAGDTEWATRWGAGMSIYEILPAKDGYWAASIGQGQAVSYRASITPEGAVTVHRTEPAAAAPSEPDASVTVGGDRSFAEMTEAELLALVREAIIELESRR